MSELGKEPPTHSGHARHRERARETTLRLAELLHDALSRAHRYRTRPSIWPLPQIFQWQQRAARCEDDATGYVVEIVGRHEGVIWQMLSAIRKEPTADELQRLYVGVLVQFRQKILDIEHGRLACATLYDVVVERLQAKWPTVAVASLVESFKRKFVLRQLVDELDPTEQRGVLLSLAYGARDGAHDRVDTEKITKEIQMLVDIALRDLHDVAKRHSAAISKLTGGAISGDDLRDIRHPEFTYGCWLFTPGLRV